MQSGLIIGERWLRLILDGHKTWEMRSRKTNARGDIGLIQRGTGLVVGTARLVDSLPPLSRESYMEHRYRHAIPESMLDEVLAAGWIYPWVLADVRRLPAVVPYAHRSGAVTFVRFDPSVAKAIARQDVASASGESLPASPKAIATTVGSTPSMVRPSGTAATVRSKPGHAAAGARVFRFAPEIAQAYGRRDPSGGFLVEAGSTAMREGSPRIKRDRDMRDRLVAQGILVPDRDPRLYRFAADHVFSSASQAAGVVKDGNASGPQLWIDETTGRSLRDSST